MNVGFTLTREYLFKSGLKHYPQILPSISEYDVCRDRGFHLREASKHRRRPAQKW